MEFDEINPVGLIGAVAGGILSVVVMSQVEVGIIFRIGAFVGAAIICYIMTSKILGD